MYRERVRIPESALRAFIQPIQPGENISEKEPGKIAAALALA